MNTPHESAIYHVTGEAVYIDDILVNEQLLYGCVYYSPHAHAKIKSFDLGEAKKLPGVHAVLCYKDIPGENQMGPVIKDEPVLAKDEVNFVGQAMFLIAAKNEEIAREAKKLIKVEYLTLEPILTIEKAMEKGELIQPARRIECGDAGKTFNKALHIIEGELKIGSQEHWYLETQVALGVPGEGSEIKVYSSTQHPSETQALIAEVLEIPKMEVEVQVRRMGGAFGGKETQANHTAIWTALLCQATRHPVKIRLSRDDDQKMTGKRHRFLIKYKTGFDDEGVISAIDVEQNADAGAATDLTMAILERTMMHAENCYYIPNMQITGNPWKTNLPPNTALRGFGGPQGMACMETIIDKIARYLKKDPAEIRYKNFYGINDRNITPYGQVVENNRLYLLYDQLVKSSEYRKRRKSIDKFNAQNEFYKKGIAITPVKFGISFTTSFLNQAGALVNVYKDGTVLVNHGGTEMGQGLNTKIRQIAAMEFGVSLDRVKVNATNTSKVPNTSATAASSGTDMNGMAVKNAIEKLKKRIAGVVANADFLNLKTKEENIVFENNYIYDAKNPKRKISFDQATSFAHLNRVSLSATGFYSTPNIHFDREKGKGRPYHYYAFGMAVTEVLLDTLTGYYKNLRIDILHDVGESLNPGIDMGQIEGGYIQGVGWCTTEECKWDEKGNLLNHSPDTYKIPAIQDIPEDFRVEILKGVPNPNTIRSSKAVGEPPLMLAFSCWLAIKDAISAVGNHEIEPEFSLPATNEVILLSIENIKQQVV
ncbi:MAG: xanthine dehydrogenase molybdopterin binding subunit [Bacteroidota bacterium]